jgi:hypothetical protein
MKTTFGPIKGELLGWQSHYLAAMYPCGTLGRALFDGSSVAIETVENIVRQLHDEFNANLTLALRESA